VGAKNGKKRTGLVDGDEEGGEERREGGQGENMKKKGCERGKVGG